MLGIKRCMLVAVLFLCALFVTAAHAQYTVETALPLALGGTASATADADHPDYFWAVTLPSDGKLTVTTHSVTGLDIDPSIIEQNGGGFYHIAGHDISGTGVDDAAHYDNLIAGTYYIKALRYSGVGGFTVTASFTPASLENDWESNDTVTNSIVLDKNGSDTGHLGYYAAGYTDTEDWYAITIPSDGKLTVTTQSDVTIDIDPSIYEMNGGGYYFIAGHDINGSGIDDATHYDNLLAGTYYIKVYRYSGYGSYTIRSTFTSASLENDWESNDTVTNSIVLDKNGSDTGHLGYYAAGYTDTEDWYAITIPSDGKLTVTTQSDATIDIDPSIYEMNGGGYYSIAGHDGGSDQNDGVTHNNLLAGTYYIRAYRYSGYGSYTIRSTFTPSALENDWETNDTVTNSIVLNKNGSDTGHLGYYAAGYYDTEDWYAITIPAEGKLKVSSVSDSTLEVDLFIHELNGGQYYNIRGSDISWGVSESTTHTNLLPGTYYIRAYRYSGYGSYTISSTFTPVHYPSDAENNDIRETADPSATGTVETGHLGYYAAGYYDTADWRSFTVPSGWDSLFIRVMTDSTLEVDMNLHDAAGNNIAHDGRWGTLSEFYYAAPAAGNYTVNIYRYSGYGAYRFIVSDSWQADIAEPVSETLEPPSNVLVSDVPNDQGHQLRLTWTISPSESAGQVGYYRIYRSRSGVMTDSTPRSQFTTVAALNSWEAAHTILADSVSAGITEYTDIVPLSGTIYYYWVQAVGSSGVSKPAAAERGPVAVEETDASPRTFRVFAPAPNPFNPSTTIRYEIPERCAVRIVVFDRLGRKVAVLENSILNPGSHEAVWNGRSDSGIEAASGIYLYRIEAGAHSARGKMTLLR